MGKFLVDIGGTKCSVAHSDHLEAKESFSTADFSSPREIMAQVLDTAKKIQASGLTFDGVGVSFGGPFDFETQTVKRSVHVSGWEEFSFTKWSQKNLAVPAVADNDGNLGALGEYSSRGSVSKSLVYVTISTGIGSGIVIDGKIYRGANSLAGELGHTIINLDGPADEMGNHGTLERYASGYWLKKDYNKEVTDLFSEDKFLEEYCKRLSVGLSNLVRILNPENLVLGGGIVNAGQRLEEHLHHNMSKLLEETKTRLELSTLGNLNVLIGAKELADNELRR